MAKAAATKASTIVPKEVAWLWPGRLALGAVTLLAGRPGLGKSMLSIDLAARLSRGELLGQPATSLLLTAEDSHEYTVVPRLLAATADLERVYLARLEDEDGFERQFQFPDDIKELEQQIEETQARFVVIDPLTAHLRASVNSWQDQAVRRALAPLRVTAEATGAAILVIGHLNKAEGADPLHRIGGSIAIPAAARSVLLLDRNPDDPDGEDGNQRVLAHAKNNLGRLSESLMLEFDSATVRGIETGVIRYMGTSSHSAANLLVREEPVSGGALAEAKGFLLEALANGPLPVQRVNDEAALLAISEITLKRARRELGIKPKKSNMNGGWSIGLPTNADVAGPQEIERGH